MKEKKAWLWGKIGHWGFLALIAGFILLTDLAILLDIPILRPLFGFIFLTFVPGFLILYVLKLDSLPLADKVVFSVGLSVGFIMLFGLAENNILLAAGYKRPLSPIPLMVSFSLVTMALSIVGSIRSKNAPLSFSDFKLSTGEKALLLVPSFFPLLSIVGTKVMDATGDNKYLMVLLFSIIAYIIFISIYHRQVSEKVYPGLAFFIGISALLMWSFRSNYLIGGDTHTEFYYFETVWKNENWRPLHMGVLDTVLSISLLPAIYQSFLQIDPFYVSKALYSLIVSSLPIIVYVFSKKYVGAFYAFLVSILIISQIMFLWTPAQARINIAIVFFALFVLVLFHDGISDLARRVLMVFLLAAILFSHYATSYITLFIMIMTWTGMQIVGKLFADKKRLAPASTDALAFKATLPRWHQPQLGVSITISMVAIFFLLIFFWYSQVVGKAFDTAVSQIQETINSLNQFSVLESRGQTVTQATGTTVSKHISKWIEFIVSWLSILLIGIGTLTTLLRFKRMVFIPGSRHQESYFLRRKLEAEYFVFIIMCWALMAISVVLPYILEAFDMSRLYFQMVIPLAMLLIVGGMTVSKYIKLPTHWIILIILIPYFMSTTGLMAQVTGFPRSPILNSKGWLYDTSYIHDQEAYSARWFGQYAEVRVISQDDYTKVWTDHMGSNSLISMAHVVPYIIDADSFFKPFEEPSPAEEAKESGGYLYLTYFNITIGEFWGGQDKATRGTSWDKIGRMNKIYTNSASEVYR